MKPYDADFSFNLGRVQRLSSRVRRVVALDATPNGYAGTRAYLVGRGALALIDPSPACEAMARTVLCETRRERITHIFIAGEISTAAKMLAWRSGASLYRLEALRDGERFQGPDWTLEAVARPSRLPVPAGLALLEERALFCGDLIDGWTPARIPRGDAGARVAGLDKIRRRAFELLWPAWGPPITDPESWLAAAFAALREGEPCKVGDVVRTSEPARRLVA